MIPLETLINGEAGLDKEESSSNLISQLYLKNR